MLPTARAIVFRRYSGIGDIVPGASMSFGLRAYTTAYAQSLGAAIDVVRASDSATATINVVRSGNLDVAAAQAFQGTSTLSISKFYDQTGNGYHIVQATAAKQPTLVLNGLGARPTASFAFASNQGLVSAQTYTQAQPISCAGVAMRAGHTTSSCRFFSPGGTNNGSNLELAFHNSSGQVQVFAGASFTVSGITEAAWHAIQGVWNGNSSAIGVDGVVTTGAAGANNAAAVPTLGAMATQFFQLDGSIGEMTAWPFDTTTRMDEINHNMRMWWGI